MSGTRLKSGGLIDRSSPLTFTFDGKPYSGFAGDTVASALIAAGVSIFGRSFKYHRPRGVWGAWVDEPNAIMTIRLGARELPNCLATTTPLEDGMTVRAVNAWPSAQYDIKGGLDLFNRWLSAGFYYKTFIWPDWHLFEPMIRKMAGLGHVSAEVDAGYVSDILHADCDTLVIGGGPSGLKAASSAASAGQSVVLVDDHPQLGGTAEQFDMIEGISPSDWVTQQHQAIIDAGGKILTNTTAYGIYDHQMVGLVENRGFGIAPRRWRMRAGRIIMATGALDRPITCANNDLPGVMSLQGAADFANRYGVLVGHEVAVMANNSAAEQAITTLENAGARIKQVDPVNADVKIHGRKSVTGISQNRTHHHADTVLMSGGLTPLVHLWRHAGGKLEWCENRQAFLPSVVPINMMAVGAANGTFEVSDCLQEADHAGKGNSAIRPDSNYRLSPLWPKPSSKGRQWIDFQHDVTLKDVEIAARENFVSVEHLKRYTTLGMASDQGKTSNMSGLAAMASIQDRPIPEVGTTTFRPPFVPIPIETFHGHHSKTQWSPLKRLPLENVHRAADAALCEYGGWLRPGWYGLDDQATHIAREARMARDHVGIFDGSPLGKIEVMGPDASAFLNFVYYNTITTLKPGKLRYGFMLTEAGIVYDDGVVACIGPNRYVISCSSSHVDGVRAHLEAWRQDGNDPDRIFIHDTTQAWATVTVTGPKARETLSAALLLDIDLSQDALPHMSLQETMWQGHILRIARVSFSGDLSYEISVTARMAKGLWDALMRSAIERDGGPIGLEAMSILRAEKGYIIIGKDTDGETMPHDLGFSAPRNKKSTAYIGDRSLQTAKANSTTRKMLIGIKIDEGAPTLPTGAHIVAIGTDASQGYVTSSYDSPTLGRGIALAIVNNGANRHGEVMEAWHMGKRQAVTLCAPCVYDPDGEKLHA